MVKIEDEIKLKRYLYLCSEDPRYIVVRNPLSGYLNSTEVTSLFNLMTDEKQKSIIDIIQTVNKDNICPERCPLLLVLAACVRQELTKKASLDLVPVVCKNAEEFFLFLNYTQQSHKIFSHSLRRIVRDFYFKTEPMKLFTILTNAKSYHGWSHVDLIRMTHLKSDDFAQEFLLAYAYKNFKAAMDMIVDNKQKTGVLEEIINKLEKLQAFKQCQDEKEAATFIKENNFNLQHLPGSLLKSQIVWDALIPQMELLELLKELGRLNKLKFLKPNTSTLNSVVEVLTDGNKCKTSKIYPAQVIIHMKTFERGKPMDPQKKAYLDSILPLEEIVIKTKAEDHPDVFRNSAISNAFNKLLQCSFRNQGGTGRRIMVTLDVRNQTLTRPCFGTKTVTYLEAGAIIALSLLKAEKDVTISVFNGTNSINIVQLARGMTFNQVQQKLKESNNDFVLLSKPFQWATEKNKHIDLFMNIFYSTDSIRRTPKEFKDKKPVLQLLKTYRKSMKLEHTKLINISLGSKNIDLADGRNGVLDIGGFDKNVPKIIEAFCRGAFV